MALNSNFRTLTADNIEGIVEDRNYLKSSFENGQLTGWTEVSVALTSGLPTGTPTIGATAASSLALSATSVTPLSGSRSMLVTVASALTAGHGFISDEFTLDRMDLGKVLTVSFDYERITGTYNFSGTLGSQTWMVYVYDATAGGANWIQPAGFLGMNQSSGPGRIRATFQSSVTAGQKYRIAVIASQAASGASSISFDNFSCSRQTAPIGPVVTDWVSYTPTLSNITIGNGSIEGRWRRVGDSAQYHIAVISGTTTSYGAGNFGFGLFSGHVIDLNKLSLSASTATSLGQAAILRAGIARVGGTVVANGTTSVAVFNPAGGTPTNTVAGADVVDNNSPYTWSGAGDCFSLEFMAPITGWSSNVQLSNDTDTRVVDFRAYTTSARTVNNTAPTIIFENVDKDSHGAYNASTGVYTVPVSGDYVVSGQMRIGGVTMSAGAFFGFSASVDNVYSVRNHYTAFRAVTTSSAGNYAEGSGSVLLTNLSAGQTIRVKGWADVASSTFTDGANTFCIQRISGPSVVAASETVAARYYNISGQSITAASYQTITNWANTNTGQGYDTHLFVNPTTGIITIPISGKYQISANIQFNSASWGFSTSAHNIQLVVSKTSGSAFTVLSVKRPWNGEPFPSVNGTTVLHLNAGETLSIAVSQGNSSNSAISLRASQFENYFSIERVGN